MRFRVQPVYTIRELAEMLGWHRKRVIRLLRRNDVQMTWLGRGWLVPLSELTAKLAWIQASAEQRDMIAESMDGHVPRR